MGTVSINSITINSSSGIGYGPFCQNKNITSVDLGYAPWTNNSMSNAFVDCNKLTSITNINPNISNMCHTFTGCDKLVNAPVIPNSVTSLYQTFYSCDELVNVPDIPNSVVNMTYTFSYCNKLVNAPKLSNSVANLDHTFTYCNKLVNAPIIPSSVSNMYHTFYSCDSLTGNIYVFSTKINSAYECFADTSIQKNVYIPYNAQLNIYTNTYNTFNYHGYSPSTSHHGVSIKENPYFEKSGDWWYDTYYGMIYKYFGNSSDIVFPSVINGHNISGLDLSSINLEDSITSIDFNNLIVSGNFYRMFNGYTYLQSITNLNKDSNITNMHSAFSNCSSLVDAPIAIPNSVNNMYMAFFNCPSLVNGPTTLSSNISDLIYTFQNCNNLVYAPTIPYGVSSMYDTFYNCRSLVNAPILPNTVTNIDGTFGNCISLVNIPEIPESVNTMGSTFYNCNNIEGNIYIRSNQITNADWCFQSTSKTKNVYIPFKYRENGVNTKTYNTFYQYYGSGQNGVTLVNYTELYN